MTIARNLWEFSGRGAVFWVPVRIDDFRTRESHAGRLSRQNRRRCGTRLPRPYSKYYILLYTKASNRSWNQRDIKRVKISQNHRWRPERTHIVSVRSVGVEERDMVCEDRSSRKTIDRLRKQFCRVSAVWSCTITTTHTTDGQRDCREDGAIGRVKILLNYPWKRPPEATSAEPR